MTKKKAIISKKNYKLLFEIVPQILATKLIFGSDTITEKKEIIQRIIDINNLEMDLKKLMVAK